MGGILGNTTRYCNQEVQDFCLFLNLSAVIVNWFPSFCCFVRVVYCTCFQVFSIFFLESLPWFIHLTWWQIKLNKIADHMRVWWKSRLARSPIELDVVKDLSMTYLALNPKLVTTTAIKTTNFIWRSSLLYTTAFFLQFQIHPFSKTFADHHDERKQQRRKLPGLRGRRPKKRLKSRTRGREAGQQVSWRKRAQPQSTWL